jgi:hypothetical protein
MSSQTAAIMEYMPTIAVLSYLLTSMIYLEGAGTQMHICIHTDMYPSSLRRTHIASTSKTLLSDTESSSGHLPCTQLE